MKYICAVKNCNSSFSSQYALALHILSHASKTQQKKWKENRDRLTPRIKRGSVTMELDTSVDSAKVLEVLMKMDGLSPWPGSSPLLECWYGYQRKYSHPDAYSEKGFCGKGILVFASEEKKRYCVTCERHPLTLVTWRMVDF